MPLDDGDQRMNADLLEARSDEDGEVHARRDLIRDDLLRRPDLLPALLEARRWVAVRERTRLDRLVDRAREREDARRAAGLIPVESWIARLALHSRTRIAENLGDDGMIR